MPSIILSDNGVSSGTAGIKTTGSNDGQLALQTTTSGGAATTALTIDTSQNATFVGSVTSTTHIPTGSSAPTNGLYLPAANTPGISSNSTKVLSVIKGSSLALEGATPQVGTGISFPATQVASSDVNTLDDYEEGTWTPGFGADSVDGSNSYTAQVGYYTKVGRLVTVYCYVQLSAKGGTMSGNVQITGLPFTSLNTGNVQSAAVGYFANLASNVVWTAGYINQSATRINLSKMAAAAAAATQVVAADIGNTTAYYIFASYITST